MEEMKFDCRDLSQAQINQLQEKLFEMGYEWASGKNKVKNHLIVCLYTSAIGYITYGRYFDDESRHKIRNPLELIGTNEDLIEIL